MSKLTRKQNNLRKAQSRFDKVSKRDRQFQIQFERAENSKGRFKTKANIIRGEKVHHGNNRGIIHKFVNLKYRVNGDAPSVTRAINSVQPTTFKGKVIKKTAQTVNFVVHDAGKTAVDTALTAETVTAKSSDIVQRETRNKLKQKYTREAVDDYHRGVFFVGKTAVDAVKGTHQQFKLRKRAKLENAKFKLKKAEHQVYKLETYKQQKSKIQKQQKLLKDLKKTDKQAFKDTKAKVKLDKKRLRSENRFKVKELRNQKKIMQNSRTGPIVLKPVGYTANRMKASAWQKAVNEDQDNDVLHAIDSAKRRIAEPVVQHISKPERLQREQKKRDRLQDQKSKSNKRLNHQENKLKEKREHPKPKPKTTTGKSKTEAFAETVKSVFQYVKNVYSSETAKFFAVLGAMLLILLLVFAFILMIFSSISSGGGFVLGTYNAQDYDLSEAEKYYTQLAWDMNQKILKVSDQNTWKTGLSELGADTSSMKDKPSEWKWGASSEYGWNPVYDFDNVKLWSFLCAYYYNFDASDNGDIKYWKFNHAAKTAVEELFKDEYEFVYRYDNTSRWEYKYKFDARGYYSIDGSGTSGSYGYIDITVPSATPVSWAIDGNRLYFDLSNGEVVNANDGYSATGWYLKNQYADEWDNSGTKYGRWYTNGETCGYGIWENGVLVVPNPYVIPECSWCSFLQKYEWKTDCRLYYNVKQKKTLDKAIEDKLKSLSHGDERVQYYNLLVGNDGNAPMYGNHQTLKNIMGTSTWRDFGILNGFGYDMQGWNSKHCDLNTLHEGIDIIVNSGSTIFAPFDCKIAEIDTDKQYIVLRKDDVEYWYDGTGGTKRDTEVYVSSADILTGLSVGDTLKSGDAFAKTTNKKCCDKDTFTNSGSDYVHIKVKIDTDGYGWDFIDPRLVLY